ncbi:MAG: XdhC family protein [Thermoanaerobaculia bacterium]
MGERDDILHALERWHGRSAALATVVGAEGSTYRREGARMVVPIEGEPVGTISGGCLEPEVVEEARRVVADGVPRLVRYDLTGEEEALVGWKLGCQGRMELLIEPLDRAAPLLAAARRVHEEGISLALVTALELGGRVSGARWIVDPDGTLSGSAGDPAGDVELTDVARRALASSVSGQQQLSNGDRVFIEVLDPPFHLVVCGAGEDARPVVELAARLGWRVEVLDHREALLTGDRFPSAARRIPVATADTLSDRVKIGSRSSVLLITHDYQRDKQLLRHLLPGPAPYVGIVGPRTRRRRLLDELAAEGLRIDDTMRCRVYGPAGLDLGAEGPEEIAWSVIAEILAVSRGRAGGSLRQRPGSGAAARTVASSVSSAATAAAK